MTRETRHGVSAMRTLQIGLRWSSRVSGGAERVFDDLAAELPRHGIRFHGAVAGAADLAERTGGLVEAFAPEESGTLTRLRGVRRHLPRLLREHAPDLLTSHFALYAAPILDHLGDRPFVMHFHGPWASETALEGASSFTTHARRLLERAVYRRADRVIVLSHAFAHLVHQQYGVREERIRIVGGAVDLERFRPLADRIGARAILGWPTDRPVLFCVRRLVQRMGIDRLVEAMVQLRRTAPEVLLCLGGTGPMRAGLEARIKALALSSHVRVMGFIPDDILPLAFGAADLTIVPTVALEGFGLVAAESLASGTPVFVTPVSGLPEVVAPLSPDLVFESLDPGAIARALGDALLGRSAVPSSSACRTYALSRFSRAQMARHTADVYAEAIAAHMAAHRDSRA